MLTHEKRKRFAHNARSAGILVFLGTVCASIITALVLTVQMVFELFL